MQKAVRHLATALCSSRLNTSFPLSELKESPLLFIFYFIFCLFRATPVTYGGSQARGLIGAIAVGLRHSHARSEPRLQPTTTAHATPDPYPTERGQGLNPQPHGS